MSAMRRVALSWRWPIILSVMAAALAALSTIPNNRGFSLAIRAIEQIRLQLELVEIAATADAPAQPARLIRGQKSGPLIVEFPSWHGSARNLSGAGEPLVTAIRRAGWNYIRPGLTGGHTTPEGCCSPRALAAMKAAVAYAVNETGADPAQIIVVGESGGGYSALCAMMQETIAAQAFLSWVAPTDLVAWHDEHKTDVTGAEIRACTGDKAQLNILEAQRRSPLHMKMPSGKARVMLYAGIHDGVRGPVPIHHSVKMFEKIAAARGGEIKPPQTPAADRIAGRAVMTRREAPAASLILFDGGHDMLTAQVMADIRAVLAGQ